LRFGLKSKILFGFLLLFLSVLLTIAYGALTFHRLEGRMMAVNEVNVPALRALNQIESSFFLLESDLDKSLGEGILRPKDTLESVINTRLDLLDRIDKESGASVPLLGHKLKGLEDSFHSCSEVLGRLYQDWAGRAAYEEDLSARRADFRMRLKEMIQDLDHETRAVSLTVQDELRSLGLVLTVAIVFCCCVAGLMSIWLARSLRPLETLAHFMRRISHDGLSEAIVTGLADLPESPDEIGTLSRESFKMASSLLSNNKLLQDQKQNLERAHQELAAQNDELKHTQHKLVHSEKLGLVGRMAAQMAHEIRNPLNALNLHAEILEDQLRHDPSAIESIAPLRKEINKLISVTESYLDLARGPRIQKTPVQLNELIEELHELYEPVLKEKGIFFTCDLGEIPPIPADRAQIAQVIGNLLKNASEAFSGLQRQGARYIRTITAFDEDRQEVTLSVMDNGAGIAPDQQKNIFSPFYTNKAEGTGLGLTFSRQVVEAHGGEISFDSAQWKGTKFSLRLPVRDRGPEPRSALTPSSSPLADEQLSAQQSAMILHKEGSAWMHSEQRS
jgi:signal transduction histidine kinase